MDSGNNSTQLDLLSPWLPMKHQAAALLPEQKFSPSAGPAE